VQGGIVRILKKVQLRQTDARFEQSLLNGYRGRFKKEWIRAVMQGDTVGAK